MADNRKTRRSPQALAAARQCLGQMFGHPTGVGCLLARKSALATLRRPWFAGGTITVASVQGDKYYLAEGAVRISVGMVTNFADVYRFMQFVESLLDQMSVQMMV